MKIKMPAKTMDYLLMGILAGIIAGIVLVTVFGITASALSMTMTNVKVALAVTKP